MNEDIRAEAKALPLAECCTVDRKFASAKIRAAGSSSTSSLIIFDLLHDAFLLGNNFWREALDESVIGLGSSSLGE